MNTAQSTIPSSQFAAEVRDSVTDYADSLARLGLRGEVLSLLDQAFTLVMGNRDRGEGDPIFPDVPARSGSRQERAIAEAAIEQVFGPAGASTLGDFVRLEMEGLWDMLLFEMRMGIPTPLRGLTRKGAIKLGDMVRIAIFVGAVRNAAMGEEHLDAFRYLAVEALIETEGQG